jgi:hypothetical protein
MSTRTLVQMQCDGCKAFKIDTHPTPEAARAMAASHAWRCISDGDHVRDLCPRCAFAAAAAAPLVCVLCGHPQHMGLDCPK